MCPTKEYLILEPCAMWFGSTFKKALPQVTKERENCCSPVISQVH